VKISRQCDRKSGFSGSREAQVFKLALRVAAAEQRIDSARGIADFRDIQDH
jgi:hypothetical protein